METFYLRLRFTGVFPCSVARGLTVLLTFQQHEKALVSKLNMLLLAQNLGKKSAIPQLDANCVG